MQVELAQIDVRPIPDRTGQLMRTHLQHLLMPYGPSTAPLYTLTIQTTFEEMVLSFLKADTSSRTRVTLTVNFTLADKAGTVLLQDTFQTWCDYNVVLPSDYSTVMENERARNQTVTNAAEDIALRLAHFFFSAHEDHRS